MDRKEAIVAKENPAPAHVHRSEDEAAVRGVIDALTSAVQHRDVEAMLAQCGPEIRFFDMVPPLQHKGADAIRAIWKQTLQAFETIEYEVHRLDVAVGDDVAFSRSLNRFGGTKKDGTHIVNWLCMTLGFGKVDGTWKILHQHVSVPFDMETGKVLLDLEP